ncbi:ABC transporter permease [Amorphus sp. 3PC139-8]|uniref:ABC transporter permease n=1 Tax=Amorphus sp. 3PC139-8 TaxID=2735676 RepID=UPI00345C89BB
MIVAAALVLQVLVSLQIVSPYVVASPSSALAAIVDLIRYEGLPVLFARTFAMTFVAALVAIVVGLPLGVIVARSELLRRSFEGWLGAAFSAPIILLYPLFLVVFGRGYVTLVVMGALVGVVPIALKTIEGYLAIPRVLENVAVSLNMTERQRLRHVTVPAVLPHIFAGIRISLIYILINIVAIDFLVSIGGLGYLVGAMYDRYDIPAMYGAILFVVLTSVIFFTILERCESWLSKR